MAESWLEEVVREVSKQPKQPRRGVVGWTRGGLGLGETGTRCPAAVVVKKAKSRDTSATIPTLDAKMEDGLSVGFCVLLRRGGCVESAAQW